MASRCGISARTRRASPALHKQLTFVFIRSITEHMYLNVHPFTSGSYILLEEEEEEEEEEEAEQRNNVFYL